MHIFTYIHTCRHRHTILQYAAYTVTHIKVHATHYTYIHTYREIEMYVGLSSCFQICHAVPVTIELRRQQNHTQTMLRKTRTTNAMAKLQQGVFWLLLATRRCKLRWSLWQTVPNLKQLRPLSAAQHPRTQPGTRIPVAVLAGQGDIKKQRFCHVRLRNAVKCCVAT